MSIVVYFVDFFNMYVIWSDIVGLDDVIMDLKDIVILFIKKKYLFENFRFLQFLKGVFFYGFLGCGKMLIVKVIVKEVGCDLLIFSF